MEGSASVRIRGGHAENFLCRGCSFVGLRRLFRRLRASADSDAHICRCCRTFRSRSERGTRRAAEPVAAEEDTEVASEAPKPAAKKPGEPMTFEELSAQLGADDKMGLAMEQSTPVAGKGLSADGYSSVTAAHQAVDTGTGARTAGDIKLSGGLTATAVRAGVHEGAQRLRACWRARLAEDPRLAGRVMVSFSWMSTGSLDVDAQSDADSGGRQVVHQGR